MICKSHTMLILHGQIAFLSMGMIKIGSGILRIPKSFFHNLQCEHIAIGKP